MMSPRRMNWAGPRRLVLHACTTRAGSPPLTRTVICCAAPATEVCATMDQAERPGARYVSYEPPAGQGRDPVVAVPGPVSPYQAPVFVREIRRDRVDERPHQDSGDPGLVVGVVERPGQGGYYAPVPGSWAGRSCRARPGR